MKCICKLLIGNMCQTNNIRLPVRNNYIMLGIQYYRMDYSLVDNCVSGFCITLVARTLVDQTKWFYLSSLFWLSTLSPAVHEMFVPIFSILKPK